MIIRLAAPPLRYRVDTILRIVFGTRMTRIRRISTDCFFDQFKTDFYRSLFCSTKMKMALNPSHPYSRSPDDHRGAHQVFSSEISKQTTKLLGKDCCTIPVPLPVMPFSRRTFFSRSTAIVNSDKVTAFIYFP